MANFALILPRPEMVAQAGRIARQLGMKVVLNQYAVTEQILDVAADARKLGADIVVARGLHASILREKTDFPIAEIRLTGLEIARLLHRARSLVPHVARPRVGVVTFSNMVGNIQGFEDILGIELYIYFVAKDAEMEREAERAVADGMDVILGGDFVNAYCRRLGKRTLFFEGSEDSLWETLRMARDLGFASDMERRNTAHLQVLLDYSFNGIIELDARGNIVCANDMACKLLNQSQDTLMGRQLTELMPAEDAEFWKDALTQQQELYFSVLELAGLRVVVNAAPMANWDAAGGMVFSFYEMKKMERQGARALRERYRLHRYLAHGRFENINHASRAMQKVIRTAQAFAETSQPILLQGEVGSGKSLFAKSIHNASSVAQGPFVTFRCAAGGPSQTEALAAAALEANEGTLYLNAIDALKPEGQEFLLRLLEESVVQTRIDELPRSTNVRVIASLDGSLLPCAIAGQFRWDLYYVLAPMLLELPPLRTQPEELEQAIDMCLDDCVTRLDRYVVLTKESRRVLMEYPWPGNYIQMKAFLERMVLTTSTRTVHGEYVRRLLEQLYPAPVRDRLSPAEMEARSPEEAALLEALRKHCGSRAAAAAELGISKTTLWRRMRQYGLTNGTLL